MSLTVLVLEPSLRRVADVLTREGRSPHRWIFCGPGGADALDHAAEADVIVGSAPSPELVAAAPRLRLVHCHGAGYDKMPFEALPPGVTVANTFHHGPSIAEHVMMVTSALLRGLIPQDRAMRSGVWANAMNDENQPYGRTLAGRSFGIIGYGEIGTCLARLARAHGAEVRAVRRNPDAELPAGDPVSWMGGQDQVRELAGMVDTLVCTVPLDEGTRGLVDAEVLAALGPEGLLINVARGGVVDEAALHEALSRGFIAGAGLDVWWNPPTPAGPSNLDFTGFENVVLTPHTSGLTEDTFRGRAGDITDNVDALAAGEALRHVVRAAAPASA